MLNLPHPLRHPAGSETARASNQGSDGAEGGFGAVDLAALPGASVSALLKRVADIMRRCDPEYCESHSVEQTTDEEWDDLLEAVEDAEDA